MFYDLDWNTNSYWGLYIDYNNTTTSDEGFSAGKKCGLDICTKCDANGLGSI